MEHDYRLGEYWITNDGKLIPADGELNHEDIIIELIIRKILDAIGYENEEFTDRISFRGWLNDYYFPDKYGWDEEDPYERLSEFLREKGVFKRPEVELTTITGGDNDARVVAINHWKWIRLAGLSSEVPDFGENTLKRLGEGVLDAIYEENSIDTDEKHLMGETLRVSTYTGNDSQNRTISIGELLSGGGGASGAQYGGSAKDAVRKMDISIQPSYYGSHLGDSLMAISNLLEHGNTN